MVWDDVLTTFSLTFAYSICYFKFMHTIMKNFYYLVFALLFTFSCEKDNVSDDKMKTIQPLDVGYYWTFVDSTFSYDGILSLVDTTKLSVIGKESVNHKGKEIELFYWKWDFYDNIWLFNNEDGSKCYYGLRINDSSYVVEKSLSIKYPTTVGDTWNEYLFDFNQESLFCYISDTIENECLSINTSYSTNVGELNCIVTRYGNEFMETYVYHCPDIGFVGLESKIDGVVVFRKRLIDYSLTVRNSLIESKSAQPTRHCKYLSNSYGMVWEER